MLDLQGKTYRINQREQHTVRATSGRPCISLVDSPVFTTNYPLTVGELISSSTDNTATGLGQSSSCQAGVLGSPQDIPSATEDCITNVYPDLVAAAAQNPQWDSCQQATSQALNHVPCASQAGRQPRPELQPRPRSQPKRHGPRQQPCQKSRVKNKRDSLLAFAAAPRFRTSRNRTDGDTSRKKEIAATFHFSHIHEVGTNHTHTSHCSMKSEHCLFVRRSVRFKMRRVQAICWTTCKELIALA